MKTIKKLVNQTAIYGVSSVVARLLNYLLVPLYTRYFLPEEYGVVTEIYAYVAFLVVFLTYGMETAFFRFSNKNQHQKIVYSTTLISVLATSTMFILITYFNSEAIAQWMGYTAHKEYIEWFAIIIGVDAISTIPFANLRYQQKAIKFAVVRTLGIVINIILNIYFIVYQEYGIEYIFVANLISSLVTIVILSPEIITSCWVFDKAIWKEMIVYALPLLIAGLAGITNETIDRILIKELLPSSENATYELGLYGAFYKLSIIMILFIQTFRFAAEPFFFSEAKQKNNKKIYADVMKYFTICMSLIFLIVIIFYDFVKQFLGSEYHDERGFLVVSILLLANLFLGIFYNLSVWYKITDKTKYGALISLAGAIITVVGNVVLIPIIGFLGSAYTTLACYVSMVIMSYFLGKKYYPINYNLHRIILYLCIMLFIYFLIYNAENNMYLNIIFLSLYIGLIIVLEKPKKTVFSKIKNKE